MNHLWALLSPGCFRSITPLSHNATLPWQVRVLTSQTTSPDSTAWQSQGTQAGHRDTGLVEWCMCHRAGAWSWPTYSWDLLFSFLCAKELFHAVGRLVASFSMETSANVHPNPDPPPKPLAPAPFFSFLLYCRVSVATPFLSSAPLQLQMSL